MSPPLGRFPRSADGEASAWLVGARAHLVSLTQAEQGVEAMLRRNEISAADAPAIDFLADEVADGLAWLEGSHADAPAFVVTELRAALGVLRNLVFALRRLSVAGDSGALGRSCQALIGQSRLHVQAAAAAIDDEVGELP
jgi:hypothetical protein